MAVLQPTHLLGYRPVRHLAAALDSTDRHRQLAEWILSYTSLPYRMISAQPDAFHIVVGDLDDLEDWHVTLPAVGVDAIRVTVEATTLWDAVQAWVLHVAVPARDGGTARLLVHTAVPVRETVPQVLQDALAEAVAA